MCEFDDETIIRLALEDLDRLMGPLGPADEIKVNRWPNSFPQYRPGHLERVSAIESSLSRELPGVFLVGAAVRGIGVPACIRQGRDAARSALSFTRA